MLLPISKHTHVTGPDDFLLLGNSKFNDTVVGTVVEG